MEDFVLQDGELAGFDIGGVRLPDGTIRLMGSGRIIHKWPTHVTHLGNTYTLEDTHKGGPYEGGIWENAIYA
jgi:hypothetical protein